MFVIMHHWAAVVSCGWANASTCRLQVRLYCTVLLRIVSLENLSWSTLHRLTFLSSSLVVYRNYLFRTAYLTSLSVSLTHTCACTHAQKNAPHAHTRTHTQTHTHARTHARLHAQTHAHARCVSCSLAFQLSRLSNELTMLLSRLLPLQHLTYFRL